MDLPERLEKRLARTMMGAVAAHRLVEPGDRILVAVSGGKDSYTMLDLLWQARAKAPFHFDMVAVHLDQRQPGYDGAPLEAWLAKLGAPFEILREDTYSVVMDIVAEDGRAMCAPCSRLRRGILYKAAERLGCNKLALGHHRDDALETLLMNLFYGGRLQAMPAKFTTDEGRLEVIRPLIECAEEDLEAHAANKAYPIVPCRLCGSEPDGKREAMRRLVDALEAETPDVRSVMLRAMQNARPTHRRSLASSSSPSPGRAPPTARPSLFAVCSLSGPVVAFGPWLGEPLGPRALCRRRAGASPSRKLPAARVVTPEVAADPSV